MAKKTLIGEAEAKHPNIQTSKRPNVQTSKGQNTDPPLRKSAKSVDQKALATAPVELIALSLIKDAAYNPRRRLQPEDHEYQKLKRSIATFGMVDPPVWNKRTGNLVGGHQRLEILRREYPGVAAVTCAVVDLDLEREKALNLALNKIEGEWDEEKLGLLLDELRESAIDETVTGFEEAEIDAMLEEIRGAEARSDEATEGIEISGHYTVVADCTDARQQGEVMGMLRKKKVACHSVTRK